MRTWNVATAVVDLIDAETAEEAERILGDRLRRQGFDTYEDHPFTPFEAERD